MNFYLTWGSTVVAGLLILSHSLVVFVAFFMAILFVTFVSPAWLIYIQQYKKYVPTHSSSHVYGSVPFMVLGMRLSRRGLKRTGKAELVSFCIFLWRFSG